MLIKTGYPNLHHAGDVFGFNMMDYSWVWEDVMQVVWQFVKHMYIHVLLYVATVCSPVCHVCSGKIT